MFGPADLDSWYGYHEKRLPDIIDRYQIRITLRCLKESIFMLKKKIRLIGTCELILNG